MKKHLGQHILHDPQILRAIVAAAEVSAGDAVLEIGPGPGTLTAVLLDAVGDGGQLVAIELDRDWAPHLERLRQPALSVAWEDAVQADLDALLVTRDRWKCVANIPYYVTSPLVAKLIEARRHFSVMALLMQKEVAVRLHASRGRDVGMLSYYVQYHAETALVLEVPAAAFRPPPQVDSALLVLRPRSAPPVDVAFEAMRPIIQAAFAARRKMLRSTLKVLPGFADASRLEAWLHAADVDPSARPETLALEDFARLLRARPVAD